MSTQSIYYNPGTQPIVFAAAAAAWVKNTAYLTGILVTSGGSTYFCLVGHTSTNADDGFTTDLAAGKWLLCTPILWTPGATPLAITKTRISAVWDRGAGHLPAEYKWLASTKWATTVVAGETLRLHLITADALANPALTEQYLTFGDADLAATSDILGAGGCERMGDIIAASATDQLWLGRGRISIFDRYVGIGGYNNSAAHALTSVASNHWVMFTSIPSVIEAAA